MTHSITLNNKQYLLVEVPEDASDLYVDHFGDHGKALFYKSDLGPLVKIGRAKPIGGGNWQFLSLLKDVTEDIAKGMIGNYTIYKNHYLPEQCVTSALESFHSLIEKQDIPKANYALLQAAASFVS